MSPNVVDLGEGSPVWERLTKHLAEREGGDVVYSFGDLERIIGKALPRSAHDHASFWSNSTQNVYSKAWRQAGYRASRRGLGRDRIRFERVAKAVESELLRSASPEHSATVEATEEWSWEGRVQAAVVRHLATAGWEIRRVADTASSEHGVDIDAVREGKRLVVEVKGFPTRSYARPGRTGTRRRAALGAQARTYFSNALLSGLLMRAEHPHARVALAFPDVTTFANLARRVIGPLADARVEVWVVDERGEVTELPARREP